MEKNNDLLHFEDTVIRVLGDPHLGRNFRTGVPLHRIGEREETVWEDLRSSLLSDDHDHHICMGDIFDKYIVSPRVLLKCFEIYREAAETYPLRDYYILQGNHDLSRDEDKKSSFDVLELLLQETHNVHLVKEPHYIHNKQDFFVLIPYDIHKEGAEVVRNVCEYLESKEMYDVSAFFGHWDIDTFGGSRPHNLVDINQLGHYSGTVVTGHVHQKETRIIPYEEGDVELIVTGSMQPYSFAEDPGGDRYVTLTLDQTLKQSADLKTKCVRVLLQPGEELPEIDCLQLVPKFVTDEEEEDNIEVELMDFNMEKLLVECLEEEAVSADIQKEVVTLYREVREMRLVG